MRPLRAAKSAHACMSPSSGMHGRTNVDPDGGQRGQVEALEGVKVLRRCLHSAIAAECDIVKEEEDLRNRVVTGDSERRKQVVGRIREELAQRDLRARKDDRLAVGIGKSAERESSAGKGQSAPKIFLLKARRGQVNEQ